MKELIEKQKEALKFKFNNVIDNHESIKDFEQFVYESEWLKLALSESIYIELLSLDFNATDIIYNLKAVYKKIIGLAEYEKDKIITMLEKCLKRNSDLPVLLCTFYHFYCNGYYFFKDLGLGYGLMCQAPIIDEKNYSSWGELSEEQKNLVIISFFPQLESDLQRTIGWFSDNKIRFTEEYNEYGLLKYVDNRNDAEKKSTVWTIVSGSEEKGIREESCNIIIRTKSSK